MKHLKSILLLTLAAVAFWVPTEAQTVDTSHMSDQITVSVTHNTPTPEISPAGESVKIGPNMVNVQVCRAGKFVDGKCTGTLAYDYTSHNLKTTGGIDFLANVISTTGTQPAVAKFLALSTDATAPAAGDCAAGSATCTLTGEVTTNGLARTAGTYAHTNGASTYTLTNTWTATGTVSSVQKAAVFNAASSGTMVFENTFTAVTLNTNDTIQVTWTITIS